MRSLKQKEGEELRNNEGIARKIGIIKQHNRKWFNS